MKQDEDFHGGQPLQANTALLNAQFHVSKLGSRCSQVVVLSSKFRNFGREPFSAIWRCNVNVRFQNGASKSRSSYFMSSLKALQFKKEIQTMDEMLQQTNSIDLQELRSACEEARSSIDGYPRGSAVDSKTQIISELDYSQGCPRAQLSNKQISTFLQKNSKGDAENIDPRAPTFEGLDSDAFAQLNQNTFESLSSPSVPASPSGGLLDIKNVMIVKQQNYLAAFEQNLKSKKKEILQLEGEFSKLTTEQKLKFEVLSNLKSQRQFYQEQLKVAQAKRKQRLQALSTQIEHIDSKMEEYERMYQEKLSAIEDQGTKSRAHLSHLKALFGQLEGQLAHFEALNGQVDADMSVEVRTKFDNLRCSQEFVSQGPKLHSRQKDLRLYIDRQTQLIKEVALKRDESRQAFSTFQQFFAQTREELGMTEEDIACKKLKKIELVAEREELDQMYEGSITAGGQEFELFLRIQNDEQFLVEEYANLKASLFSIEILNQIKGLLDDTDEGLMKILDLQDLILANKASLTKKQQNQLIADLTKDLEMEIDHALLLEKFDSSSAKKDFLYSQRFQKLQDLKVEIDSLEAEIKTNQQTLDNLLLPQQQAVERTFYDLKARFPGFEQALAKWELKLKAEEESLEEAKKNFNACSQTSNQIESVSSVLAQVDSVRQDIQIEEERLSIVANAKLQLDRDFAQMEDIKSQALLQRAELQKQRNLLDPLNSTLSSSRPDSEKALLEDEQIKALLESLDSKISAEIDGMEKDSEAGQRLQTKIKEAKDSFTFAFKQLKEAKAKLAQEKTAVAAEAERNQANQLSSFKQGARNQEVQPLGNVSNQARQTTAVVTEQTLVDEPLATPEKARPRPVQTHQKQRPHMQDLSVFDYERKSNLENSLKKLAQGFVLAEEPGFSNQQPFQGVSTNINRLPFFEEGQPFRENLATRNQFDMVSAQKSKASQHNEFRHLKSEVRADEFEGFTPQESSSPQGRLLNPLSSASEFNPSTLPKDEPEVNENEQSLRAALNFYPGVEAEPQNCYEEEKHHPAYQPTQSSGSKEPVLNKSHFKEYSSHVSPHPLEESQPFAGGSNGRASVPQQRRDDMRGSQGMGGILGSQFNSEIKQRVEQKDLGAVNQRQAFTIQKASRLNSELKLSQFKQEQFDDCISNYLETESNNQPTKRGEDTPNQQTQKVQRGLQQTRNEKPTLKPNSFKQQVATSEEVETPLQVFGENGMIYQQLPPGLEDDGATWIYNDDKEDSQSMGSMANEIQRYTHHRVETFQQQEGQSDERVIESSQPVLTPEGLHRHQEGLNFLQHQALLQDGRPLEVGAHLQNCPEVPLIDLNGLSSQSNERVPKKNRLSVQTAGFINHQRSQKLGNPLIQERTLQTEAEKKSLQANTVRGGASSHRLISARDHSAGNPTEQGVILMQTLQYLKTLSDNMSTQMVANSEQQNLQQMLKSVLLRNPIGTDSDSPQKKNSTTTEVLSQLKNLLEAMNNQRGAQKQPPEVASMTEEKNLLGTLNSYLPEDSSSSLAPPMLLDSQTLPMEDSRHISQLKDLLLKTLNALTEKEVKQEPKASARSQHAIARPASNQFGTVIKQEAVNYPLITEQQASDMPSIFDQRSSFARSVASEPQVHHTQERHESYRAPQQFEVAQQSVEEKFFDQTPPMLSPAGQPKLQQLQQPSVEGELPVRSESFSYAQVPTHFEPQQVESMYPASAGLPKNYNMGGGILQNPPRQQPLIQYQPQTKVLAQMVQPDQLHRSIDQGWSDDEVSESSIGHSIHNLTERDVFLLKLKPLLDGSTFYKKFSKSQTIKQSSFDPLQADRVPPEQCGFGIRKFQLDPSLKFIAVSQNYKSVAELKIQVSDIIKPILPSITMEIIKFKKKAKKQKKTKDSSTPAVFDRNVQVLAKMGVLNKDVFKQKCLEATCFPFSLALKKKSGQESQCLELIATNYEVLREWIAGINLLTTK